MIETVGESTNPYEPPNSSPSTAQRDAGDTKGGWHPGRMLLFIGVGAILGGVLPLPSGLQSNVIYGPDLAGGLVGLFLHVLLTARRFWKNRRSRASS